jgi:alkanesulfonate monooxygenase SsuD/methylene tetrahydromethanopterin reductase-like flavin-dependent oxidoreductase (luciferase family)
VLLEPRMKECFEALAGTAEQVAHAILGFGDLGVDRITVLPPTPGSAAELAPHLFHR